MATKRISAVFGTLAAAELFQDQLYDQYSSVRLTRFPIFSEDGVYVWEVR